MHTMAQTDRQTDMALLDQLGPEGRVGENHGNDNANITNTIRSLTRSFQSTGKRGFQMCTDYIEVMDIAPSRLNRPRGRFSENPRKIVALFSSLFPQPMVFIQGINALVGF